MNDTILLVTASYDVAADYVGCALRNRKSLFFRLDTDKFPSQVQATFSPREGITFSSGSQRVAGRQIKAVWYRRLVAPDLPPGLDRGTRDFCERETRAFLNGVLATLPTTARWLSAPLAVRAAESKPYQLKIAADLGFLVPNTTITNHPGAVLELSKCYPLAAKAVSSGYIASESGNKAIFTSRVGNQDLEDLESLSLAPVTFQEFVEKQSDIRVTVVGDNVFAAEILSQASQSSRVDWRATEDPNLPHRRHELPDQVASLCRSLTGALGLSFGAIDLALYADGQYMFFEINPNGEWVWIEDQLQFPISQTIAEWLDAKAL